MKRLESSFKGCRCLFGFFLVALLNTVAINGYGQVEDPNPPPLGTILHTPPDPPEVVSWSEGSNTYSYTGFYRLEWSGSRGLVSYYEWRENGGAWVRAENSVLSVSLPLDPFGTSAPKGKSDGSYVYEVRACNDRGCSTATSSETFYVENRIEIYVNWCCTGPTHNTHHVRFRPLAGAEPFQFRLQSNEGVELGSSSYSMSGDSVDIFRLGNYRGYFEWEDGSASGPFEFQVSFFSRYPPRIGIVDSVDVSVDGNYSIEYETKLCPTRGSHSETVRLFETYDNGSSVVRRSIDVPCQNSYISRKGYFRSHDFIDMPSGTYSYSLEVCAKGVGTYSECVSSAEGDSVAVVVDRDYILSLPESFDPTAYRVYLGDFDRDGQEGDLLLFGVERVILIHGEIVVPIVLQGPPSFKLVRQSDGSYVVSAAQHACDGGLCDDYEELSLAALLQAGEISQIPSADVLVASFNGDNRNDFVVRDGERVFIFHWNSLGPELVSLLDIPPEYRIEILDVNSDGRSDIQIFYGTEFIRVLVANSEGRFTNPGGVGGSGGGIVHDSESKRRTIETTWQLFSDALSSGDHASCIKYLTPNFSSRFSEVLDVLGDDAGEVVEQVESIAPYYSDENIAIYLVKKLDDNGEVNIHTITFHANSNGSWKIEEM